jgi:alcohol dehydrogenase (cytochrome c)
MKNIISNGVKFLVLFLSFVFVYSNISFAGNVTDTDILNDAITTGDVLTHGIGTQGQRFSPLTQINDNNVKRLVPAWTYSFGGEKQRG